MQVYDLSALDGALLGSGLLLYLRPVKRREAIAAALAAATLLAAHWLAPYPLYGVASIVCPLSFVAYLLHSRGGWQRLRLAATRRRPDTDETDHKKNLRRRRRHIDLVKPALFSPPLEPRFGTMLLGRVRQWLNAFGVVL